MWSVSLSAQLSLTAILQGLHFHPVLSVRCSDSHKTTQEVPTAYKLETFFNGSGAFVVVVVVVVVFRSHIFLKLLR